MKKFTALFLLLVFMLCGCNQQSLNKNLNSISNNRQSELNNSSTKIEISTSDKTVDTLLTEFLSGEKSAIDKNGRTITINEYLDITTENPYQKYAIYDMNGDKTPELIIKTPRAFDIFTVKYNKVTLWYRGASYCKPLNNRAILYERPGGAPDHTYYQYIILDYTGEELLRISFAEYYGGDDPSFFERFGSNELYHINEQQVTKTIYENLCKTPILSIADDAIEWQDIPHT